MGACALLVLLVPRDPSDAAFSVRFSELKAVILNKWLLILSAGLITEQICFSTNLYFMVYYLEESLRVAAGIAGAIGGVTVVVSILAAPLEGRAFDRSPSPKMAFIVLCFAAAGGLAIAAVPSVYAALLSGLIVGATTSGAYIFGVSIARTIGGARQEYGALKISWINGIAFLGGVWAPSGLLWDCGGSRLLTRLGIHRRPARGDYTAGLLASQRNQAAARGQDY